jgi:hypothetical protein
MAQTINRFSCKCKLCKAAWTTETTDRTMAYNAHEASCPKYTKWLAARIGSYPQREAAERYQMSVLYFQHLQIHGHYVADKPCDGRCIGATGHNCECSCGGKNHGIGSLAA